MNETLVVDAVPFSLPGFVLVPDLSPLLGHSAQRGADWTVPGVPGVDPHAREIDVTLVNLEALVYGEITASSVAHPDVRTGLYLNMKALQALTDPPATAAGTRTATLTWQGETPAAKPVHVLGDLQPVADGSDLFRVVVRLSFPEGLFEL